MADNPQQPSAPLAEISLGPSPFELFLDRHQKSLLGLLVLLILAVAAFVVYRGIQESTRIAAGNALYRANDPDALQKVVSEHPKTPAAASARVLLAEKQWAEGKQDAAIQTLTSFLSEAPNHPGIPAARAALAAKLMSLNKAAEASSVFEEIIDDPASAYLAPYALLCLGDMAAAGGNKDKAKQLYERSQSEFPNSGFNQKISQRIAALNATLPVEIDPPATPAATPNPTSPSFPVPLSPDSLPKDHTIPPTETPAQSAAPDASNDQS